MKESMEARVEGLISMLKGVTDKSVAVGFGVSRPEQVRGAGALACCACCAPCLASHGHPP
jgi:tryptophan synthase alpha subunit